MKKHNLFIILILTTSFISAQYDQQPASILKKHKIIRIEGFLDSFKNITEPLLVRIEKYNSEGRILSFESANTDTFIYKKEFFYRFDTFLYVSKTYRKNKLIQFYKYEPEKLGKKIKIFQCDTLGNETDLTETKKYNNKFQLIENIRFRKNQWYEKFRYKYYISGNIKEKIVLVKDKKPRKIRYYENGRIKHYENDYHISLLEYNHGLWIIKNFGKLPSFENEIILRDDGLIDREIQYINGVLRSKLSFKYYSK